MEKKTKYDTNPLDPDVERNADEAWGEEGGTKRVSGGATRDVGSGTDEARRNVYSEAPTRTFDSPPLEAPYPSVFVPPTYAPPPVQYQSRQNVYQPPASAVSSSRPVAGIGIPEKWALMLAYAPSYIGLIVSLIELFLVPRSEAKVRFHASQALALQIVIMIGQTLFGVIGTFTGSRLGGTLFSVASFIFLIISMIRVWKGEPHRIAPLAEPAQWFNDHIEPRKKG